jgi:hypothetical protein
MDTREFTPELAETMKAAFERVCRSLGLARLRGFAGFKEAHSL